MENISNAESTVTNTDLVRTVVVLAAITVAAVVIVPRVLGLASRGLQFLADRIEDNKK